LGYRTFPEDNVLNNRRIYIFCAYFWAILIAGNRPILTRQVYNRWAVFDSPSAEALDLASNSHHPTVTAESLEMAVNRMLW